MRILHVHSGNLYGGVERLLVTLARHEREVVPSMESHFAVCFEGRLSEELVQASAPVHLLGDVRVRHVGSVWRARSVLRKLLASGSYNVVVCHSDWSNAIFGSIARRGRKPLVRWVHGLGKRTHWLEVWARMTKPDVVLCNSYFTRDAAVRMFPGVRSEVLYCPAEPPTDHSWEERLALRSQLATAPDATVLVQVSRMEAGKGQKLHLQALALLQNLPGWVCWQVGGSQRKQERRYLDELVELARNLGLGERIRFLGERTDVSRVLAAADIYCQPNSSPEGFGMGLIEALWARLPIVTSDMGGAREIVLESCGILVGSGDAARLADCLGRLICDTGLRARLGASGPARARELCDCATQITLLEQYLTGIRGDGSIATTA